MPEVAPAPIQKQFTLADVKASKETLIVLHDKVYDLKEFKKNHPGGPEVIEDLKNTDATNDFEAVGHPASALGKVQKYIVGTFKK